MPRRAKRPLEISCRLCGQYGRRFSRDTDVCVSCAGELAHAYRTPKTQLSKYGLTPEQHGMLFVGQRGKCAICRKRQDEKTLAVDHDHSTGAVRGLLCMSCNTGIGHFKDDPALLAKAIIYLTEAQRAFAGRDPQ